MNLSENQLELAKPFSPPIQDIDSHTARLTPTETRVLSGVRAGLLNKQIAHELGIAEATVKAHMTALMRKLNVRNRTQAAMLATG